MLGSGCCPLTRQDYTWCTCAHISWPPSLSCSEKLCLSTLHILFFNALFFFKKKSIFENIIYYHCIYITYAPPPTPSCILIALMDGWLSLFLGSG